MCVRFAIGLAEAGFYPAVLYHMAFWYKPIEMPQRIAIFYSLGQLSPAVSGLLAYAIGFMVSNPISYRLIYDYPAAWGILLLISECH